MARPNSYKTRRQLVHCRIDIVTTRRNVVVNSSYLEQNSQTTRTLSYRSRDYSKKCSTPVKSRHYTVLCRKSYGTRNNTHYVVMVDRKPRTRENLRQKAKCVRELYDNLRVSYAISTRKAPPTLDAELWRDFQTVNLIDSPRQCTRYGDMLRLVGCVEA